MGQSRRITNTRILIMNTIADNQAIENMIKQQLRTGNVVDEAILELFTQLPRADFIPEEYRQFAYSDLQIPLAHGQRMMTPLEEGLVVQSLNLNGNETVLEIGTGSGYLTALLAKRCHNVVSVDIYPEFSHNAATKMKQFGIDNVEFFTGDGHQGWMEKAPYHVIVLTGAINEVTKGFKLQLMKGGKLFAVLGDSAAMHGMLYRLDQQDEWHKEILFDTSVPALIDKTKHQEFKF